MKRKSIAVSAVAALFVFGSVCAEAGIVYIGSDPSYHVTAGQVEGYQLAGNALSYVGATNSGPVAYVDGAGGVGSLLTTAGFTNLTPLSAVQLATANLSIFQAVYIGTIIDAGNYVPAAANVQNFVSAGGGLVSEAEVSDPASWAWLPQGNLIGSSGLTNVGHDQVTIVAPANPVMLGLTNAGLSNWSQSVHSIFSTPQAGGFIPLAVDDLSGFAYIIATPIPEPASFVLFGLGAIGLFMAARRRRRA